MHRSLLLIGLVVLAAPPADADEPAAARTLVETIAHQDRQRSYRLRLPRGHDPKVKTPLVLALHGGGGTAEQFDRGTGGQIAREADARGWLVCFPQGVSKAWNDGRRIPGRRGRQSRRIDDVGFLSKLIDHLVKTRGVDPARVYATGMSNGGFMSFRLGLELSDKVAAIAPVTATLAAVHEGKKPSHPVGLMVVNGTRDPLVPYEGGHVTVLGRRRGAVLSTKATVKHWARSNGCKTEPKITKLPDTVKDDGAHAVVKTWSACESGASVTLVRVEGGGHTWPGGRQYLGRGVIGTVCRDFEAASLIFDFFGKHERVRPTTPEEQPSGR